jgi:hypothetical protein
MNTYHVLLVLSVIVFALDQFVILTTIKLWRSDQLPTPYALVIACGSFLSAASISALAISLTRFV